MLTGSSPLASNKTANGVVTKKTLRPSGVELDLFVNGKSLSDNAGLSLEIPDSGENSTYRIAPDYILTLNSNTDCVKGPNDIEELRQQAIHDARDSSGTSLMERAQQEVELIDSATRKPEER